LEEEERRKKKKKREKKLFHFLNSNYEKLEPPK
jgi:hypothetical protein